MPHINANIFKFNIYAKGYLKKGINAWFIS